MLTLTTRVLVNNYSCPRDGSLDTRTHTITDAEPLAEEKGLPVFVDVRQAVYESIARDEPVFEDTIVEPARQPDPPPQVPTPRREEVDLDAAFADFEPERVPDPQPAFDIQISRSAGAPELLPEPFVVTSLAVVDVEGLFVRLAGDRWEPEDQQRVPKPPAAAPVLYRDRIADVRLSALELRRLEIGRDQIRIRPRAVSRELTPGLLIRKSIAHHATAGENLSYTIEVTNPHDEVVPGVIVEESVPTGWSIVNATPRGVLLDDGTLRWDVDDLAANQSHRFTVEVIVGQNEAAQSNTVVTTGAAVESIVNVDAKKLAPDPVTVEPVPVIVNDDDNGWQASKTRITVPPESKGVKPPALPPGRTTSLKLATIDVDVPGRVGVGAVTIRFTVKNTGTVRLDSPSLHVALEKQLSHHSGMPFVRHPVGALDPQQSRTLILRLKANEVGAVSNRVQLRDGGQVLTEGEAVFSIEAEPDEIKSDAVKPISHSEWRSASN